MLRTNTYVFDRQLELILPTKELKEASTVQTINNIPRDLYPDFRLTRVIVNKSDENPLSYDVADSKHFSLIRTLRFGKIIGRGALWDVYELPDIPGYVTKLCIPYGTLWRPEFYHLQVADIVKEVKRDTGLSRDLAPSRNAPDTHRLWRGF
ncbi:hypothetical protein IAR50_001678 [Cryptococcus sp. DSM 104548]